MSKCMYPTWKSLRTVDGAYRQYCTFGKRFTKAYLKCLFTKHSVYREPIIEVGGIITTYYCHKCDRRYYP